MNIAPSTVREAMKRERARCRRIVKLERAALVPAKWPHTDHSKEVDDILKRILLKINNTRGRVR